MARLTALAPGATILAAALLGLGGAAEAQTLADMVRGVERAAERAQLATRRPGAQRVLDSLTGVLRASGALALTTAELRDIALGRNARLETVARWRRPRYAAGGLASVDSAVAGLRQVVTTAIVPMMRGTDDVNTLLEPLDDLGTAIRGGAQAVAQERLRRYEIKYGPESPRLNAAEVVANYAGQLLLPCTRLWPFPCLGVRADRSPSPYELVIGYRTTDLTASDEGAQRRRLRIVSSGQVGLRVYDFGERAGEGGRVGKLRRPTHRSVGVFLMPPRDAPMTSPFSHGNRVGAFVGWGGVQLGYVGGRSERVVLGMGLQIIPYLF